MNIVIFGVCECFRSWQFLFSFWVAREKGGGGGGAVGWSVTLCVPCSLHYLKCSTGRLQQLFTPHHLQFSSHRVRSQLLAQCCLSIRLHAFFPQIFNVNKNIPYSRKPLVILWFRHFAWKSVPPLWLLLFITAYMRLQILFVFFCLP